VASPATRSYHAAPLREELVAKGKGVRAYYRHFVARPLSWLRLPDQSSLRIKAVARVTSLVSPYAPASASKVFPDRRLPQSGMIVSCAI
jgi:hypothetical protein